jgi:hypothetical protein
MRNLALCFILTGSLLGLMAPAASATDIKDIVGIVHIGGRYWFPTNYWPANGQKRDYLNDGANAVAQVGTNVIKVWLHPGPRPWYWYTANPDYPSTWWNAAPENRLVLAAQSPQFTALFQNPSFKTYVIDVMANLPVKNNGVEDLTKFGSYGPMLDGMTAEEQQIEWKAINNLAAYLLATYRYTGKTFVLQNWEGDHILADDGAGHELSPVPASRIQPMIDWTNLRQDAVTSARNTQGTTGVQVYYAAEVNDVTASVADPNHVSMVNSVLPSTHCDLYSYSAWDAGFWASDVDTGLPRNLDYIADHAPDSAAFGDRNVYLGEYGGGENVGNRGAQAQLDLTRRMTEIALGWGVRYALYWEIYDNGLVSGPCVGNLDCRPQNADMEGNWLIRPDGTHAPVYDYFANLFTKGVHRVTLRSSNNYYACADEDQNERVVVDRPWALKWEHFALIDQNGGALNSGDPVTLISHTGHYASAENGGGDAVNANRTAAYAWETFTILKQNGAGTIGSGDSVAIRTGSNYYFCAEGGGGQGSVMNANRTAIGVWETFGYAEE